MRSALLLLCIIMTIVPARPARAECPAPSPHLDGSLRFRGDRWPLRLRPSWDVATSPESLFAELDIPDLLMAGRRVVLRCAAERLVVELPFGFGAVALAGADDGALAGSAIVGGDTLKLEFRIGAPPPYRVAAVTFTGGAGTLNGELFIPAGNERRAGVVVVHGSGPQGLGTLTYRSWGDFYARRGLVALVYDKRGVGGSDGDFTADSAFEGLITDALAAVDFLRRQNGVDQARVGIAGHSQAGWIAFRAAARSPRVTFLALLAAPTVGVAEQELQRVRHGMRAQGLSPDAVRAAEAHTRLMFGVVAAQDGWNALERSSAAASRQTWADWVHRPDSPANLHWWRTHADVDPATDIGALRIPIFAAFSALDPVVPALQNAGLLREFAAARPGSDITVLTVAHGDHRLELPAGLHADGRWHLPRVHPEFIATLTEWLEWRWAKPQTGPGSAILPPARSFSGAHGDHHAHTGDTGGLESGSSNS